MNDLLKKITAKLDALAIRERALVGITVLALIFISWDTLIRASFDTKTTKLTNEIDKANLDIINLNAQLESEKILQESEPNAKNRAAKAKLAFDLAKLNEELDQLTVGFIEPKLMIKILEELFSRSKDLELIRMENMGGTPLLGDDANNEKKNDNIVFRHGVVIEFKGKYLDTLKYLKAIENMPWRFYWGGLKYTVDEYPDAHVTITLYTLSLNEGWVGV